MSIQSYPKNFPLSLSILIQTTLNLLIYRLWTNSTQLNSTQLNSTQLNSTRDATQRTILSTFLSLLILTLVGGGIFLGSSNPVIRSTFEEATGKVNVIAIRQLAEKQSRPDLNIKKIATLPSVARDDTKKNALGQHIRAGKLSINTNTAIAGTLEVAGDIVLTGRLLGEGFVSSVIAGDNVTITEQANDDGSVSPIISVTIPTSVTSFQGSTGAITLTAGTGITIDGTKITASAKLSDVRSAGGCSGCITNDDVANDITISSSGSVDVGALSGTVAIGKGGTGLTGYTKGDIMYTSATDTLAKLGIGTSGEVLTVSSSGTPEWAASLAIGSDVQAYDTTLGALAAYNTNGILVQTGADTFTGRTITGTSGTITVTNGSGVAGNPTLTIASDYIGQNTITTLGTIGTGVWQGTAISVGYGGTGQTSYTDGQLLIGNTTGNTLTKATLTAGSGVTITNGNGSIEISASGTGDITAVGSMTTGAAFADSTADDDWLGLGSSAGRIEFDDQATDEVNILGANVGIGTSTPSHTLQINPDSIGSSSLGTSNTSINFTTEGDYTQQDATDGTDFSSGSVVLHNSAGGSEATDTFNYTGANQTFTVPAGVTSVTVKMWGAGGGGSKYSSINGSGGGGGYSTATVSVTPGESLTVIVGGGGAGGWSGGSGNGGFGGGGRSGSPGNYMGGGGGGYSGIFRGTVTIANALVAAGGGGGAGLTENIGGAIGDGGAGGGTSGVLGEAGSGGNGSGGGGTQSAGGSAGTGGSGATAGSALTGGAGATTGSSGEGGGGGGGYYGGGGGDASSAGTDGGGGGSGRVSCSGCSNGTTTAGSGATPGNSGDADRGTAGNGGVGSGAGGNNGIVLITYNTTSYPTTQSYYVTTAAATQIDSSSWTAVSSVSITQTLPTNTNIKYLVSFDGRTTWKYWSGSAWASSTLGNIDTNGMTKTTIEAITSSQWSSAGGFSAGTLDFAAALSTSDSAATPTLDLITVNYTSSAQALALTSAGNLVLGSAALATTATDGFLYLTSVAGAPSGTPTSYTGRNALVFDTTNNKLCNYDGSWLCSGALTDYAEWAPAEGAEIADLVSVTDEPNTIDDPDDPFMLGKSNTPYDSKIVGVVSEYAEKVQVANGYKKAEHYRAIALAGRVPVKVSTESGSIRKGDFLTSSSTPGVAMKATRPGFVIGKALEDFTCVIASEAKQSQTGIATDSSSPRNDVIAIPTLRRGKQSCQGKILAFIQPSYADPSNILANLSLDSDGSLIVPTFKEKDLEIASIESRINDMERRMDLKLKEQAASITAILNTASDSAQLNLAPPSFSLSEATFSGMLAAYDLSVSNIFKSLGETFLGKTTIAGDLSVDGTLSISKGNTIDTIGTLFLQSSPLADLINIFNGKVIIDKQGALTAQKVISEKFVAGTSTLGTETLKAGQTEVSINTQAVTNKSNIFTSLKSESDLPLFVDSQIPSQGFKVKISKPSDKDIVFSWWIVDAEPSRSIVDQEPE